MRNVSFALTENQYRAGTKQVTRRRGWANLKRDERVMGCSKCMGLRPGMRVQKIHPFETVSVQPEPLRRLIEDPDYGRVEAILEGFPELDGPGFVEKFCRHIGGNENQVVNRIHFTHLFPHEWIHQALDDRAIRSSDNNRLHDEVARAFLASDIPFEREVKLIDRRVDFMVLGHVAVEVRSIGSNHRSERKAFRYLEDASITQAIVISAATIDLPSSGYLAQDGTTKPLHKIELSPA